MKYKIIIITCFVSIITTQAFSGPPEPGEGFRWVVNTEYSDEFNGTSLDKTKWRDSFDGWKGRPPAKFVPSSVSVSDGMMQIKNGVLSPADGAYTIAGGAVQSLGDQAHFGYYECRLKASKIIMSTTFWLSNKKKPLSHTSCTTDTYSQELDITEVVGGYSGQNGKYQEKMNFNTHYRHVPCGESKEVFHSAGSSAQLSSKVFDEFHTYACWWPDATKAIFYADDEQVSTIQFSRNIDSVDPFDRPMRVNMVTETYDWAKPHPSASLLNNDDINTSYYDWIRAYSLVAIDSVVTAGSGIDIFEENIVFNETPVSQAPIDNFALSITYTANEDRDLNLQLKNTSDVVVGEVTYKALAGYGKKTYTLTLDALPAEGNYTLTADLRPIDGVITDSVSSVVANFQLGTNITAVKKYDNAIQVYPNPASNQIMVEGVSSNKTAFTIFNQVGETLSSGNLEEGTIDISSLAGGIYLLNIDGQNHRFVKR